jgi:hypothetical protein
MLKKTFGHVEHAPDCCASVLSLVAIAARAQVQYLRYAASRCVNRHRLSLASWFATEQTFKRTHSRFVGLLRNCFRNHEEARHGYRCQKDQGHWTRTAIVQH